LKAMERAKQLATSMGIHWLIHIDDDELLYAPVHRSVGEILNFVPHGIDQAKIPNVEAVYSSPDVKSCFLEAGEANTNKYKFVSYVNGKAAVRLANTRLRPAGPHEWRAVGTPQLKSVRLDKECFGSPLMVVHYEGCPFDRWRDKYWELGNTSPEQLQKIPFAFYRDSITRIQHCATGQAQHYRNSVLEPARSKNCNETHLKNFWAEHKSIYNPQLRRQDLMPVSIPWRHVLELGI